MSIFRILEAADRAGGLLNVPSSASMQRVVSGGLGLEVWDLETLSDSNLIVGIKVRPVQNFIENRRSPDAGETLNCTKQRNFSVMTNDSSTAHRSVNNLFIFSNVCTVTPHKTWKDNVCIQGNTMCVWNMTQCVYRVTQYVYGR